MDTLYSFAVKLKEERTINVLLLLGTLFLILSAINPPSIGINLAFQPVFRVLGTMLLGSSVILLTISYGIVKSKGLIIGLAGLEVLLIALSALLPFESSEAQQQTPVADTVSVIETAVEELGTANSEAYQTLGDSLADISDKLEILVQALTPTPTPTPEVIPLEEATPPAGMALVAGGSVNIGTSSLGIESAAHPRHTIVIEDFWMHTYEVSNRDYLDCFEAGICEFAPARTTSFNRLSYFNNPDFNDYPVIWVSYNEAEAYCKHYIGGDIPTEFQWEMAARGKDDEPYPWDGTTITPGFSNLMFSSSEFSDTARLGAHQKDKSPYRIYDLAGNVSEWTRSWLASYPNHLPQFDYTGRFRVVRGGNFSSEFDKSMARVFYRGSESPETQSPTIGFRCVWEPVSNPDE